MTTGNTSADEGAKQGRRSIALLSDEAVSAIVLAMQKPKMDRDVPRAILRKLAAPFPVGKVRWKPGQTKGEAQGTAKALAFIDSRDVENRLDDVLGLNWSCHYSELRGGKIIVCRIDIVLPDGRVVSRENGSDDSDIEPEKGALSGALRRAGTMFGIGRYLYGFPRPTVQMNGKYIANDAPLRAEEKKVWDAWIKAEEQRKAKEAGAKQPPAPTTEKPPSQPNVVAAQQHDTVPVASADAELSLAIERMNAAVSAEEVQGGARPHFAKWGKVESDEGVAFRAALEANMQRFTPGWTIASAQAAYAAQATDGKNGNVAKQAAKKTAVATK